MPSNKLDIDDDCLFIHHSFRCYMLLWLAQGKDIVCHSVTLHCPGREGVPARYGSICMSYDISNLNNFHASELISIKADAKHTTRLSSVEKDHRISVITQLPSPDLFVTYLMDISLEEIS